MLRDLKSDTAASARHNWEQHAERGNESAAEMVRSRLSEDRDRVIVVEGEKHLSRWELYAQAVKLGSALIRRGLSSGSVVAFQLPNWIEACVISLACDLYGFVLCPLLLMYRERGRESNGCITRSVIIIRLPFP